MVIANINNGETGLAIRGKLNELIDRSNAEGGATLTPDTVNVYSPNQLGGYVQGSVVAYSSETVGFESPKLYRALVDIPIGESPEGSPEKWFNEGDEFSIVTSNTSTCVVSSLAELRAIEGMKTGDTVIVTGVKYWYRFASNVGTGIKPNDGSAGSWLRKSRFNESNLIDIVDSQKIGNDFYLPYRDDCLIVLVPGIVGMLDANQIQFYITITQPSFIVKTGLGFTESDYKVMPISEGSGGGGLASIAEPTNAAIRAVTGYASDIDVLNYTTGGLFQFNSASMGVDNGTEDSEFLRPDDILVGDAGRWQRVSQLVKKAPVYNVGTLKKFDINGNDEDSGLTGASLDIYDVSAALKTALSTESNWRDVDGNPIITPVFFTGGIKGQRYYSDDFFFECTSDNSWRRTYQGRPVLYVWGLSLTIKGYLEDVANWTGKNYTGTTITGVPTGVKHYSNDYYYEFVQTNLPIRIARI